MCIICENGGDRFTPDWAISCMLDVSTEQVREAGRRAACAGLVVEESYTEQKARGRAYRPTLAGIRYAHALRVTGQVPKGWGG